MGPVLVLLSIPLMLRWVPRNRFYGFRVAPTLRSDGVWYEINAASGRQLCLLGLLMVGLEFVLPTSARNYVLWAVGAVGVVANIVVNWRAAYKCQRRIEEAKANAPLRP